MTVDFLRGRRLFARLLVLVAGWAVAIATSLVPLPVETASVDVALAVGPAAPSTAVVEVAFLGAFVESRKFVCAFVPNGDEIYGRLRGVSVNIEAVALDADVTLGGGVLPLSYVAGEQVTTQDLQCAELTCQDEPCGGRLALTLVDRSDEDPTRPPDPDRLEPVALQLVVAVNAAPGALPGEAIITLVETRP